MKTKRELTWLVMQQLSLVPFSQPPLHEVEGLSFVKYRLLVKKSQYQYRMPGSHPLKEGRGDRPYCLSLISVLEISNVHGPEEFRQLVPFVTMK